MKTNSLYWFKNIKKWCKNKVSKYLFLQKQYNVTLGDSTVPKHMGFQVKNAVMLRVL